MSFQGRTWNPWFLSSLLSKKGTSHFPANSGAKESSLNRTMEQGATWHPCFLLGIKRDSRKESDFFPMQPRCSQQREFYMKLDDRKAFLDPTSHRSLNFLRTVITTKVNTALLKGQVGNRSLNVSPKRCHVKKVAWRVSGKSRAVCEGLRGSLYRVSLTARLLQSSQPGS
nr:calcineurin subunit B type 1 isoform X3 [Odocoileus virginianus texanus]